MVVMSLVLRASRSGNWMQEASINLETQTKRKMHGFATRHIYRHDEKALWVVKGEAKACNVLVSFCCRVQGRFSSQQTRKDTNTLQSSCLPSQLWKQSKVTSSYSKNARGGSARTC